MIKKGLIAGVVILIAGFILSPIFLMIFPTLNSEYETSGIFRPWTDPLMMAYFLYPFIFGLAASYFWKLSEGKLKGDRVGKALGFAKIYFLIATIPGMFVSYTSFQISFAMVATWTISGFIDAFIAGWIFAKVK